MYGFLGKNLHYILIYYNMHKLCLELSIIKI